MKKIILFLLCVLLMCGCGRMTSKDLIEEINKKIEKTKKYQITATLEIFRNEEKFTYDVISTYKSDGLFKVELTNKMNNHHQVILKNKESVYVITPSLNKTFKFQSEWPYNNSQIYLLQPVINDVLNDSKSSFESNDNGYIITSKVEYTSEKNFKKQKIYFDTKKNLKKIEVVDDKEQVKMSFKIKNIDYNININEDLFDINKYENKEEKLNDSKENDNEVSELNEIVYPMYVPLETHLASQDIVNTEFGERIISIFSGNNDFTIVQENIDKMQDVEYVYGDPYLILDTVGAITEYSINWISNGIEFSVMSNDMPIDELMTVAQSINVKTVGK